MSLIIFGCSQHALQIDWNFTTLSLYLTSWRVHHSIRVGLDDNAGLSEAGAGGPSPHQNFGKSVNPISTRGADYAHHYLPPPRIFRLSYGPVMLGFSREIIFIFHVSRHPLLNLCKINLSMLCKKSTHVVWYYVTNPSVTSDKRLRLAEFRGVNKQDQRSIKMAV